MLYTRQRERKHEETGVRSREGGGRDRSGVVGSHRRDLRGSAKTFVHEIETTRTGIVNHCGRQTTLATVHSFEATEADGEDTATVPAEQAKREAKTRTKISTGNWVANIASKDAEVRAGRASSGLKRVVRCTWRCPETVLEGAVRIKRRGSRAVLSYNLENAGSGNDTISGSAGAV